MSPVLEVQSLTKQFADVKAVDGISFSIPEGICFGLLGPNGAGKTTTIEMMEGISKPTSGSILYRGKPIDRRYNQRVGIQFQHTALQDYLTVKECLNLFAKFYDHHLPIEQLIELCSLGDFLNRDNRKLSGGQKQRLLLAIALINDPDLLFLDEPTTGLDPQARHNFWMLIDQIKKQGKTIVLTTHYMDEAQTLCDDIVIMDKGHVMVRGTPDSLLSDNFSTAMIRLPQSSGLDQVDHFPFEVVRYQDKLEFSVDQVEVALNTLIQYQVPLDGLNIEKPNLEDLFLKLTGHSLRA